MNLPLTFKNSADDLGMLGVEPGEALQAATEVGYIPYAVPANFSQLQSAVQHVTHSTDVRLHVVHGVHLLT